MSIWQDKTVEERIAIIQKKIPRSERMSRHL